MIGALTNAINGAVSPHYFRVILGWQHVENVWQASVAQGVFEGLIYGVIFALVFTTALAAASKARSTFSFAAMHLLALGLVVLTTWAAGGLLAMGLASMSPEFYRSAFIGVPDDDAGLLRYAWVGGSIWGALIGGLLSGTVGSVVTVTRWKMRNAAREVGVLNDMPSRKTS